MDVLALQLFREREYVFDKYVQQGYLGRFLLYLIDKIVQASVTSFKLLREEQAVAATQASQFSSASGRGAG